MPSPVPTPVAAALGLVPTVLEGALSLPAKALRLPVFAVSTTLSGLDTARRGYDDLAERGERLIARLRGTSFDELEDRFEDTLKGTRLAAPYDRIEDALEDAADTVTAFARNPRATAKKATTAARTSAGRSVAAAAEAVDELADRASDAAQQVAGTSAAAAQKGTGVVEKTADVLQKAADTTAQAAQRTAGTAAGAAAKAADEVAAASEKAVDKATDTTTTAAAATEKAAATTEVPEAEAPKGQATPKATEPDTTRAETAATADVVDTVERVASVIGGEVLAHDDLPLPDYDHLTLGALRGRMRSLDLPQLVQLRDYEKAKANRLPVVTMLDNRIAKLASDPTAPLSGGDVAGASPKASSPKSPGRSPRKATSKISPVTASPEANTPKAAHGGLGGSTSDKS